MSLNLNTLEKVRKLENGMVQARCPACAEGGNDRKGEHLRIMADGRFGCCVHPKDGDHRKRIFALAGEKSPGTFTVRVKVASAAVEPRSVKAALTTFTAGTLGTVKPVSDKSVAVELPSSPDETGTLGTPISNPYAYRKNLSHMYKDLEEAVPIVPTSLPTANLPPVTGEKLPYLTAGGTLVIPFDSPERYHWWKPEGERQSVATTLAEVRSRMSETKKEENYAHDF